MTNLKFILNDRSISEQKQGLSDLHLPCTNLTPCSSCPQSQPRFSIDMRFFSSNGISVFFLPSSHRKWGRVIVRLIIVPLLWIYVMFLLFFGHNDNPPLSFKSSEFAMRSLLNLKAPSLQVPSRCPTDLNQYLLPLLTILLLWVNI